MIDNDELEPLDALTLAAGELPLSRNPAALYLARLAPSGRASIRSLLSTVSRAVTSSRVDCFSFAWHRLRYAHVAAILTALRASHRASSLNLARSAIRGVLREAWRVGLLTTEELEKANDIPRFKATTLPTGRALSAGELRALFEACERDLSPAGARDAALLGLLYGCGLRISEAVSIDFEDSLSDPIKILGKGNKERLIHLPVGARKALDAWNAARGAAPGPLFTRIPKGNRRRWHAKPERLAAAGVRFSICDRRAREAGVPAFTPHDLRRTFISDLLSAGCDLAEVAAIVGHSIVETTRRYDRRPEESRRGAVTKINVPYRGRDPYRDDGE